jgi:hypothetical protein
VVDSCSTRGHRLGHPIGTCRARVREHIERGGSGPAGRHSDPPGSVPFRCVPASLRGSRTATLRMEKLYVLTRSLTRRA